MTTPTGTEAWLERIARGGARGRSAVEIAAELGRSAEEGERAVAALRESGGAVTAAGRIYAHDVWQRTMGETLAALRAFHADEPLKGGMPRETLRIRVAREMPADAFRELLQALSGEGAVRLDAERVAASEHRVVLAGDDAAAADRIERAFRDAGLDPPAVEEVLRAVGGSRGARIRDWLVEEGRLVRIRDGRLFHAEPLQALRDKLREFSRTSSTIEIGTFKELAGATRRNAIPLLEHFDDERLTRREGNVRRILTNDAAG
jgi:selenocysteine-specific elongation factor